MRLSWSIPFQYLLQSAESKYAGGVIAIAYLYTFSSYWEESEIENLRYQIPINFEKAESYLDLLNDEEIDENAFKLKYGLKEQIEKLRTEFAKTSKKEGCYIATAIYGSYSAKEVRQLCKFRDEVLLQNVIGKWFVKIYYLLSPPIAKYLKNVNWLNKRVKMLLDYFVKRLE